MADAVESMAWAGETPWHGLGKRVLPDLTTDQMLVESGLDWNVYTIPLFADIFAEYGPPQRLETSRSALIRDRDNRVLSIISNDWNPVQNSTAFDFFTDFVQAGDMEMHTAGSLFSGEVVWALAKVKESFKCFGDDEVESFLLFSNPHRYGQSIDIRFTPIRVVCANTLALALGNKTDMSVKLNHRKAFDPELAKRTLKIASKKLGDYKEMAEFLGSKRYTADNIVAYFNEMFPTSAVDADGNPKMHRNAKKALDVIHTQPGHEYAEGTWWQAANAITFLTNHKLGNSDATRLESAWYGANRKLGINAFAKAVEYAEAG